MSGKKRATIVPWTGCAFRGIQETIARRYHRLGEEPDDESTTRGVSSFLNREELLELEQDLLQLRHRLAGEETKADEDPVAGSNSLPVVGDLEYAPGVRDVEGNVKESLLIKPRKLPRSLAEFGVILRHGQQVDQLASGDTDRFQELLAMAEEALRAGSYFKAERRFNRALRFTPGHPLATVGLAHTQIGAGLYLSASLTLRSIFSYQPEMIDTKYSLHLIPNRPRLFDAITTLEERLDVAGKRTANAFLLAYVGRLLGERKYVVRGLEVMSEDAPDDKLLPLLREVWLFETGSAVLDPSGEAGEDAGDKEPGDDG